MENVTALSKTWLYQGPINKIVVALDPAPKSSGGYVIALELSNGTTRIAASRDPARYITQLMKAMQSFGFTTDVSRVFISHHMLRYETIKRWIGQELRVHKVVSDSYSVPINVVTRKLSEALVTAEKKLG